MMEPIFFSLDLIQIVVMSFGFGYSAYLYFKAVSKAMTTRKYIKQIQTVTDKTAIPLKAGQLVYTSGKMIPDTTALDPDLPLSVPSVKLKRDVHMFQWTESSTTDRIAYSRKDGRSSNPGWMRYLKEWQEEIIDSDQFFKENRDKYGDNPKAKVFRGKLLPSKLFRPQTVYVSKLKLPEEVIDKYFDLYSKYITFDSSIVDSINNKFQGLYAHSDKKYLYLKQNSKTPEIDIGDLRVRYKNASPGIVSIIARIDTAGFIVPFTTKSGREIFEYSFGKKSINEIILGNMQDRIIAAVLIGFFIIFIGYFWETWLGWIISLINAVAEN